MTDPPVTTCQVCALPVSKLISASAISFKGSGWYVTDYSNKMKPPSTDEQSTKPAEPKKDGAEKPAATTSAPPSTPPAGGPTGSGSTPAPT